MKRRRPPKEWSPPPKSVPLAVKFVAITARGFRGAALDEVRHAAGGQCPDRRTNRQLADGASGVTTNYFAPDALAGGMGPGQDLRVCPDPIHQGLPLLSNQVCSTTNHGQRTARTTQQVKVSVATGSSSPLTPRPPPSDSHRFHAPRAGMPVGHRPPIDQGGKRFVNGSQTDQFPAWRSANAKVVHGMTLDLAQSYPGRAFRRHPSLKRGGLA
jgi:hypothetical protein